MKIVHIFLSVCFFANGLAYAGSVTDSKVFNWEFYLANNPDLVNAGITTESRAISHWTYTGISEGRQASASFHSKQYVDKYADIKSAFGNNYLNILQHYLNNGFKEGRVGILNSVTDSRVFDWRFYLYNNPDLINAGITTESQAKSHWTYSGLSEGRQASSSFHSKQYVDKYSDIKSAFGNNYLNIIQHYLDLGSNEGRIGYFEEGSKTANDNMARYQRITVSNKSTGQSNNPLYVGLSGKFAGAIDSIYWEGKEFINSHDHGRQMQFAWQIGTIFKDWNYDNQYYYGECFNPTEAGSERDAVGYLSGSILSNYSFNRNVVTTASIPAYWIPRGNQNNCRGKPWQYEKNSSNDKLSKKVTVSPGGIPNLIKIETTIVPEANAAKAVGGKFEVPAIYTNPEFNKFFKANSSLTALSEIPHTQSPTCDNSIGRLYWPLATGCEVDGAVIATNGSYEVKGAKGVPARPPTHAIGAFVLPDDKQYYQVTYSFFFEDQHNAITSDAGKTTFFGPVAYTKDSSKQVSFQTYIAVGKNENEVMKTLKRAYTERP